MSKSEQGSPEVPASVIYCGDCLDELKRLPDNCIDLVYLDPPFNSNRNYEVFWGDTRERLWLDEKVSIQLVTVKQLVDHDFRRELEYIRMIGGG